MMGPNNKKPRMKLAENKYIIYFVLGFNLFIYSSIIIFQILRWIGVRYDLMLWDFYINMTIYISLPIPKVQEIYYYYNSITLTNRLTIFIYNIIYWPVLLLWLSFVKVLLIICRVLEFYITLIDLLLDLTRLFIFYLDTDLDEFVRKHPVFDSRTEFFVDKRLINLINYMNSTLPRFYTYIPRILIQKYDYMCSIIWKHFDFNLPNVAWVYTAFSLMYFVCILYIHWIVSHLQIIAENHFSLLILITGIMNDLLYWCYPWLYRYDFVESFSIPTYMDFLHNHRHPRGVNVILVLVICNFLDKAFNTNIFPRLGAFLEKVFFKLRDKWLYLKSRKFLLFVTVVVFVLLPKLS